MDQVKEGEITMEYIISAAEFIDEPARTDLQKWFSVRENTLDIAYSVPGYKESSRETKNYLYDTIREKVASITF